jgi:hypothetical protein
MGALQEHGGFLLRCGGAQTPRHAGRPLLYIRTGVKLLKNTGESCTLGQNVPEPVRRGASTRRPSSTPTFDVPPAQRRRRVRMDTLVLLKHLLDDGLSKTAIAERLGVSRRVIHHWIATGLLARDLAAPPSRRPLASATKLDRYAPIIADRWRPISSFRRCGCSKRCGPRGTAAV